MVIALAHGLCGEGIVEMVRHICTYHFHSSKMPSVVSVHRWSARSGRCIVNGFSLNIPFCFLFYPYSTQPTGFSCSALEDEYHCSWHRGAFSFARGKWTRVQEFIRMNTPGIADGIYQVLLHNTYLLNYFVLHRKCIWWLTEPLWCAMQNSFISTTCSWCSRRKYCTATPIHYTWMDFCLVHSSAETHQRGLPTWHSTATLRILSFIGTPIEEVQQYECVYEPAPLYNWMLKEARTCTAKGDIVVYNIYLYMGFFSNECKYGLQLYVCIRDPGSNQRQLPGRYSNDA